MSILYSPLTFIVLFFQHACKVLMNKSGQTEHVPQVTSLELIFEYGRAHTQRHLTAIYFSDLPIGFPSCKWEKENGNRKPVHSVF